MTSSNVWTLHHGMRQVIAHHESNLDQWLTEGAEQCDIPSEKPAPGKMTEEQLLCLDRIWLSFLHRVALCIEIAPNVQECIDHEYGVYCREWAECVRT